MTRVLRTKRSNGNGALVPTPKHGRDPYADALMASATRPGLLGDPTIQGLLNSNPLNDPAIRAQLTVQQAQRDAAFTEHFVAHHVHLPVHLPGGHIGHTGDTVADAAGAAVGAAVLAGRILPSMWRAWRRRKSEDE